MGPDSGLIFGAFAIIALTFPLEERLEIIKANGS